MKRAWKISESTQTQSFLVKSRKIPEFSCRAQRLIPKPSYPVQFLREHMICARQSGLDSLMRYFSDRWSDSSAETLAKKYMSEKVTKLKCEISEQGGEVERIEKVLEENGRDLFRIYKDGSAMVELFKQLQPFPEMIMEVLSWRRKQLDCAAPMTVEEYSKGIVVAGRLYNLDLAIKLYDEAANKKLKEESIVNALMSAYVHNGFSMKCESLFKELMNSGANPSIVTYNILISAYGSIMLVDQMEAIFKELLESNLTPTIKTYRALLDGYLTAWKWEGMERTYQMMKESPVKPDMDIQLLMLRGYANSGKLEKMEELYEMVRDHVDHKEISLIRGMIQAYCRSSHVAKVEKVEELLKLIPESEYRPWLNVILICLYAKEDLLDKMENSINEAFHHKTYVTAARIMKCIVSSYYRLNAVDQLADFVHHAELAGWKIHRCLYHCRMVMYSSQMRLSEMESVLDEMSKINMHLSKKTFLILYKAYQRWGQRNKVEQVLGLMCKHGHRIPSDACAL